MLEFKLLLILLITNGAPIVADKVFANKYAFPVDFGFMLTDGMRFLGSSKTYRGLFFAILFALLSAVVLGFSWKMGLILGCTAMLGDLISSFIKRRLGMEPSSMALGLDQIPESLFPLLAVSMNVGLGWWQVCYLVLLFFITELILSRILYKFNIRKRPY